MQTEIDPVICQTVLLTYDERDLLQGIADRLLCTREEAARFIILKALLMEEELV